MSFVSRFNEESDGFFFRKESVLLLHLSLFFAYSFFFFFFEVEVVVAPTSEMYNYLKLKSLIVYECFFSRFSRMFSMFTDFENPVILMKRKGRFLTSSSGSRSIRDVYPFHPFLTWESITTVIIDYQTLADSCTNSVFPAIFNRFVKMSENND